MCVSVCVFFSCDVLEVAKRQQSIKWFVSIFRWFVLYTGGCNVCLTFAISGIRLCILPTNKLHDLKRPVFACTHTHKSCIASSGKHSCLQRSCLPLEAMQLFC